MSSFAVLLALGIFTGFLFDLLQVSRASMGKPVPLIAAALLSLVASVYAQQLDPINNFCNRFDHQCRYFCSMGLSGT